MKGLGRRPTLGRRPVYPLRVSLVASRRALGDDSRVWSSGRTHVDTAGLDRALDGGVDRGGVPASGGTGTHSHGVAAGRLEGNRTTASTTRQRVHLSSAQGGGVGLVIAEEPFLRGNQVPQVRLHAGKNRLFLRVGKLRNCDRGQNADDHDHDQQLDQGKTLAVAHYFLLLSSVTTTTSISAAAYSSAW